MARLELLAALQPLVGERRQTPETEDLFRVMQEQAFSEWLNYTLEEQHADLSLSCPRICFASGRSATADL
jgi:hypothetical protein